MYYLYVTPDADSDLAGAAIERLISNSAIDFSIYYENYCEGSVSEISVDRRLMIGRTIALTIETKLLQVRLENNIKSMRGGLLNKRALDIVIKSLRRTYFAFSTEEDRTAVLLQYGDVFEID